MTYYTVVTKKNNKNLAFYEAVILVCLQSQLKYSKKRSKNKQFDWKNA